MTIKVTRESFFSEFIAVTVFIYFKKFAKNFMTKIYHDSIFLLEKILTNFYFNIYKFYLTFFLAANYCKKELINYAFGNFIHLLHLLTMFFNFLNKVFYILMQ